MKALIIFFSLFFLIGFNAHGMETTDKKISELSDETLSKENSNLTSTESIQFGIRGTGTLAYGYPLPNTEDDPQLLIQRYPLLLELQVPIITTPTHNIKWLIQTGVSTSIATTFPSVPTAPSLYIEANTGLKYNFQPFSLSLLGGPLLGDWFGRISWTGQLFLGWQWQNLGMFDLEIGPSIQYYYYDKDEHLLLFGVYLSLNFNVIK